VRSKGLVGRKASLRVKDISDEHLREPFFSGEELAAREAFRSLVMRQGPLAMRIRRHVSSLDHNAFWVALLVLDRKRAARWNNGAKVSLKPRIL
jgi:hypothetical protein